MRKQATRIQSAVMDTNALLLWALFLSLSWLLPVHFPPWNTFPAEVWSAVMVLISAGAMALHVRTRLTWHSLPLLCAVLVVLVWLQYAGGLIPFAGQAWTSSAYLISLLLALLVGARWEEVSPKQLAHGLFFAIGVAAVLSVGLQLYTWLGLQDSGVLGMWSLAQANDQRPSANLGQPNQLATLLLWGLLAVLWACVHGVLRARSALVVAVFLIFGLALTQSRTGLLGATVVLAAIWAWRKHWASRRLPWVALGLYLFLLLCPLLIQGIGTLLQLDTQPAYARLDEPGNQRLEAWRLFVGAIWDKPWYGYGWTETTAAQLSVADRFPSLGGLFSHSHNLVVDLMLWVGVPLGLAITAVLAYWFWSRVKAVKTSVDAVLVLFVVVVGVHAMLEFPLQYANFLLPTGLVMGMLSSRLGATAVVTTPRWVFAALALAAAGVLAVTVRDYAEVDDSYTKLRLEQSFLGQGRPAFGGPPAVWALTHFREWIVVSRLKVHSSMGQDELGEMERLTTAYPSRPFVYRLARAFALNKQPQKAQWWLAKICKITDEKDCRMSQRSWAAESKEDARIAAVPWPAGR